LVFIGTSLHVEIYVFGSIHEHQAQRTADSLEGESRRELLCTFRIVPSAGSLP
jgi:hypothetical protein